MTRKYVTRKTSREIYDILIDIRNDYHKMVYTDKVSCDLYVNNNNSIQVGSGMTSSTWYFDLNTPGEILIRRKTTVDDWIYIIVLTTTYIMMLASMIIIEVAVVNYVAVAIVMGLTSILMYYLLVVNPLKTLERFINKQLM